MYYIPSANKKNGFGFPCQAVWILADMKITVAFFLPMLIVISSLSALRFQR